MGAATVWEMGSALAPGYTVEMVIVGGEMSGYCETGSDCEAMTPASVMRIATTLAQIGRSMKKGEKFPMACPYFCACLGPMVCTTDPGRSFTRLSTITMSPSARPEVTTA